DQGNSGSGGALTATSNVAITVNPVNDAPTFTTAGNVSVLEDAGPQTVNGWAAGMSPGPSDESGQTVTFQVTGNTNPGLFSVGVAVDSSSGDLTFTSAADANGTADITVVLADNGGTTSGGQDTSIPQTFTITVIAVNDAPVSSNGFYQPTENTTLVVAKAAGLETLTTDIDNSSLTYSVILQPVYGALVLNTDGSFTYTPDTNFNRTDFFTYRASDGGLDSNISTVTLQVETSFPWHNGIMPLDVNDDGMANLSDVLLVIDSLNLEGNRVLPVPRARPLSAPFFDINRDGMISSLDILALIQDVNRSQRPIMQIRIETTDLAGNILQQVNVGDSFLLTSYVLDLQPAGQGVFAAYFDIEYQAGLVSVSGAPNFTAPYLGVTQFGTQVNGSVEILDEIGAASTSLGMLAGERALLSVPMVASSPGVVSFTANEADQPVPQAAWDLAESLGIKVSDVPGGKINYGSYQLAILPSSGGGEPEGEAFSLFSQLESELTLSEARQLPTRLELSDWSVPRRSEPVIYQQAVDDAMRTLAWQPQPVLSQHDDQREDELAESDELAELIDELAPDAGSAEWR
ncbi:MAG: Ig-like domain-containing protein, partial [Pirellulaceae bacterium]